MYILVAYARLGFFVDTAEFPGSKPPPSALLMTVDNELPSISS